MAVAQRARAAAEDEVAWDDDPRVPSPAASPRPALTAVPSPAKVCRHLLWVLVLGFSRRIVAKSVILMTLLAVIASRRN